MARKFLGTIKTGLTAPSSYTPSQDRPARIGNVDAAYAGTGLAKVLLDGETVMGSKGYAWLNPYAPVAGDRVLLAPVGRGYVIVGSIETSGDVNTWTPNFTVLAGTFTLGTGGSIVAWYQQVGKVVTCSFLITFGTTPSLGDMSFTLPVPALFSNSAVPLGPVAMVNASTTRYAGAALLNSASTGRLYAIESPALNTGDRYVAMSATIPVAAAVGFTLGGTFSYLAA